MQTPGPYIDWPLPSELALLSHELAARAVAARESSPTVSLDRFLALEVARLWYADLPRFHERFTPPGVVGSGGASGWDSGAWPIPSAEKMLNVLSDVAAGANERLQLLWVNAAREWIVGLCESIGYRGH